MEFTAELIAGFLSGEVVGNKDAKVWTISKIEEGTEGSLSFLSNPKYEPYIYQTDASIVIVNKGFEPSAPIKATLVKVDDAYACFAKLLELYAANKPQKNGVSAQCSIHPSAVVGEDCYIGEFAVVGENARIGKGCKIYPQCYIGDNARIGDGVTLYAGVKIYEQCVVGDRSIIHSGAVIGADGFGFAPTPSGVYSKIPQIGNVIIEHDVEIGANTTIDRATMGSTLIKHGVKLDNQIQIGHNVVIGENTVCAAQLGVAGSAKIGASCITGGQVGIVGHITIGNNVMLGSKTGVTKSIPDGVTHVGYPSMEGKKFHRTSAVIRNLPELSSDVFTLKKEVKKILEQLEK